MNAFTLARKYLWFHRSRSIVLVACVYLTLMLPVATFILLGQFNQLLVERADSTPAIVGAPGSPLELSLNTLHFRRSDLPTVPVSTSHVIRSSGLATAIPMHVIYTAQDWPCVGTTPAYFQFRQLSLADGDGLQIPGDCVIGAVVARKSSLSVGDSVLTDRDNVLGLAGEYPLKLRVVGVLEATGTPDDRAVFVDLKTAWVIQGLGHGHQNLADDEESDKLLSSDSEVLVASAAVLPYQEINESNLAALHFHGDPSTFPVTSVIVVPRDVKSGTILEGRFRGDRNESTSQQWIRPGDEIRDLMQIVFQVKRLFDVGSLLIAAVAAALLAMVIALTLKLRSRELLTMFRLGCARGTMQWLVGSELAIIFGMAILLVAATGCYLWIDGHRWIQNVLSAV